MEINVTPFQNLSIENLISSSQSHQLIDAFTKGPGYGLLALDQWYNSEPIRTEIESNKVSESITFWRDFTRLYLESLMSTPDLENWDLSINPIIIEAPKEEFQRLILTRPLCKGSEYINIELLSNFWLAIEKAIHQTIKDSGISVSEFFSARFSSWKFMGRVCFHLVENKNSQETPFAFFATYSHKITKEGTVKHLPLNKALEEYAGTNNKKHLLRLLMPLDQASKLSLLLKNLVTSGAIFHPQAWTPDETYQFLKDLPYFEKSGIIVKVPNWWKAKSINGPTISVKIGNSNTGGVGLNSLLDFSANLVLGENNITEKEIKDLLSQSENLVFFKGQWVTVDHDKLTDLLSKWKQINKSVAKEGLTFGESLRWLSGIERGQMDFDSTNSINSQDGLVRTVPGVWLEEVLNNLRAPEVNQLITTILKSELKATLRPYQKQGVSWLYTLSQLQMGAILADDMGLGKTIQIIALLLIKKSEKNIKRRNLNQVNKLNRPSLLVIPASLLGNWKAEIQKFGPSLKIWIAHSSGDGVGAPPKIDFDLVITTFGSVPRIDWLNQQEWDLLIADEAQAIKNPSAQQTKSIKKIKSLHRLALTGTPIENSLSDLWSLFDFVSPGLLGTAKIFEGFMRSKSKEKKQDAYGSLRILVKPYILRRLKTDKSVISDLPDKTELKSYCPLTKAQVVLYKNAVETLRTEIKQVEGIQRRGIVLSYLMRFKQICNHPSQFMKSGDFKAVQSGKFQRLKEICEVIADKQEKVLVFTQFKEMTVPLSEYLENIFGTSGLILHGDTPIKKRAAIVEQFQNDYGPQFFILSLKAGGTGLNLTKANHVIHFDRWWNPAVENQATDRAFRIGQKNKVLVHKFICKGTLEEKIDELIESKKAISDELLEDADHKMVTEMSNEELLKLVSLDLNSALED